MKIIAYKCPDTEKIFEDYASYKKHRIDVLKNKRISQEREARLAAFDDEIREFREGGATDLASIANWILANQVTLVDRSIEANHNQGYSRPSYKKNPLKITQVDIRAQWRDNVSNTHNAPIGMPTNWHCRSDLPRGYPGWYGDIKIYHEGEFPSWVSDLFRGTGICLGGGSGGIGCYRSELLLFEQDWPSMSAHMKLMVS